TTASFPSGLFDLSGLFRLFRLSGLFGWLVGWLGLLAHKYFIIIELLSHHLKNRTV
ncbi:hypothetical protein HKBW3S42_02465, partial [Candidatus Hakubella thermalkaliphila]